MEELKKRKTIRLLNANYNDIGMYFITICTMNRKCILSKITDEFSVKLLPYGIIADKYINQLNDFYNNISIESYVIMPNHIHFILFILQEKDGPSRTPVPTTAQNSTLSRFISTFKRFCNKEYGENIWQYRSFDHIIRNSDDYQEHLKYIYENPIKWYYDELYEE